MCEWEMIRSLVGDVRQERCDIAPSFPSLGFGRRRRLGDGVQLSRAFTERGRKSLHKVSRNIRRAVGECRCNCPRRWFHGHRQTSLPAGGVGYAFSYGATGKTEGFRVVTRGVLRELDGF